MHGRGWWNWGFGTLSAIGVLRDVWLLFRSPVALGIDGYYYVVQAQHLESGTGLYYATSTPAVLALVAAGTFVVGDPIVSLKICALILCAALAAGVFGILRACTGNAWCGALGAALMTLPTMHLYLVVEFVNNLGALALLSLATWSVLRALDDGRRIWWIAGVTAAAVAVLAHRMAWMIVPAGGLVLLVAGRMLAARRPVARLAVGAAAVGVVWAASGIFGWFNWPARTPPETLISPMFPLRFVNPTGGIEIALLIAAAPAAAWMAVRNETAPPRLRLLATATALWTMMLTLNPWLNHSMGEERIVGRIDHLAFVQVALLVPALFCLGSVLGRRQSRLGGVAVALLVTAACFAPVPYGARPGFLIERERLVAGLSHVDLPPGVRVIARHGDQFLVTYVLGVEAERDARRSELPKPTYWLVRTASWMVEQPVADLGELAFALLQEEALARLDATLAPEDRAALRRGNSHWQRYVEAGPGR